MSDNSTDFTRERFIKEMLYGLGNCIRSFNDSAEVRGAYKFGYTDALTNSLVREMASELEMMVYAPDAQCFSEARVRGIEALERYNAVVKELEGK